MQPSGLPESSRWSQRSEDHRLKRENNGTPTGCQMGGYARDSHRNSRTLPGCKSFLIRSGGFRFASTTGYCLAALRAVAKQDMEKPSSSSRMPALDI